MRLPQNLVSSPLFVFDSVENFVSALDDKVSKLEIEKINTLMARGLPPAISAQALAVMLGVNTGLIWSFVNKTHRHYRVFGIPKGKGVRTITAPRVALKIVQKWLSFHLTRYFDCPDHVFGFVPGRSYIGAALRHKGAKWAYSADIKDFFGSTSENTVVDAFKFVGYDEMSAKNLARICCFRGALAQGAPSSPILSNICFRNVDSSLIDLANKYNCTLTRYADDIVFSGKSKFPVEIKNEFHNLVKSSQWSLAEDKELFQPLKGRIKIHGLLIGRDNLRLTRGYRNKIRAYAHILAVKGNEADRKNVLAGHIRHARHVSKLTGSLTGISENDYVKIEI